ncbi:MAG: heavy metal sensor histidine kinase [Burkholderiales bacterium]|nr:heavy metal sensor histidine kinase [Burkholderiales bacterium]
MFSKHADLLKSGKPWSITRRLTTLYTLSTFSLLLLGSGFLYWVLLNNLKRENNQFLTDKVHVLRSILHATEVDPEALNEEVQWEGRTFTLARYYARVLDTHGKTLIETPGMDKVLSISSFPAQAGLSELPGKGFEWKSPDGKPFLLMSALAQTSSHELKIVQVALDLSQEGGLIVDYRHKLSLVLLAGLVLSAGLSMLAVRKGLAPLKEITRKAQRITSAQLHERILAERWPAELSDLATAFDDMLDRLEESFQRLSQFSADLAHELRTPINNLMGETEVALSRSRIPEEYRHVLESGLEEYGRLSRMIDSLLFLARAEQPAPHIERTQLDAGKELEAVRAYYEVMAEEKAVSLSCNGDAALYADVVLFRRALGNLVSNALYHTHIGGSITLTVEESANKWTEVRVSDTGTGIETEHLPRLFDRFYRVDGSRSAHPDGSGLGLAIVKSVMTMHGGTVEIHSLFGQGTTVVLRFPCL